MPMSPRRRAELIRQATPPATCCARCPGVLPHYLWQQRRDGGRHIRVDCGGCGRFIKFAPQVEPFLTFADITASETPILDALTQSRELGIELHSDGEAADFAPEDRQRAPRRLRELVRQCSHDLAGLLGRTEG